MQLMMASVRETDLVGDRNEIGGALPYDDWEMPTVSSIENSRDNMIGESV